MRVKFNGLAWETLRFLVGQFVAIPAYPVAFVAGVARHPDAFFMLAMTIMAAAILALQFWLVILFLETAKMLLTMLLVSLHHIGLIVWRRVSG